MFLDGFVALPPLILILLSFFRISFSVRNRAPARQSFEV
jgi:hypothetical protein